MGLKITDPCFEISGKWEKRKICTALFSGHSSFRLIQKPSRLPRIRREACRITEQLLLSTLCSFPLLNTSFLLRFPFVALPTPNLCGRAATWNPGACFHLKKLKQQILLLTTRYSQEEDMGPKLSQIHSWDFEPWCKTGERVGVHTAQQLCRHVPAK